MFAIGTDSFVIAGILPGAAHSLGVGVGTAGWLITAYAFSYAVLGPLMAAATTRWPRRRLFLTGLGIFVVGNLLTALVPVFGVALASRAVAGLGGAMVSPTAVAAAAALAPPERRGRAIATVLAGLSAATALGAPIGTGVPQRGELLAVPPQHAHKTVHFGITAAPGGNRPQVGDEHPGLVRVFVRRVDRAGGGIGEPAVDEARPGPAPGRLPAHERDGRLVLYEGLVQVGDDLRGSRREPVEERQQPRRDVRGQAARGRGHGTLGQVEQMVALVAAEAQRTGEGGQDLRRRLSAAPALQLGAVVRRQARELSHLLPPQPGYPAAGPGGQTDVARPDPRAPGLEERGEFGEVHARIVPCTTRANQGPATPGCAQPGCRPQTG